jgi:hypothetical protein
MRWSVVPFGKHKGKTFPEIILRDPDWFFWALPKLYGKLADEAKSLAQKARAIKIPKSNRGKWEVEYQYDCDQRFCGFVRQSGCVAFAMDRQASIPGFAATSSPEI